MWTLYPTSFLEYHSKKHILGERSIKDFEIFYEYLLWDIFFDNFTKNFDIF